MRELKYLIIHCTATPEGRAVSSDDIRAWHTGPKAKGGRGWNQVGYSDMIHLDGRIENLVEYDEDNWVQNKEITNGAGVYNSVSRHIVYVGGTEKNNIKVHKNTLTPAQSWNLHEFIKNFIEVHPNIIVVGHKQVNVTACPGFDIYDVFGCVIPTKNRLL